MATTAAGYADVAKEVWDSDTMAKQFYDENPWLDRLQKSKRVVIGKRAQVPIHKSRAGGTTIHDASGGTINSADSEDVDQAQYTLAYNYFPVEIQVGALNEITGGAQSVGDALEHMMSSGINNIRNQVSRQFLTGHGRVAQCGTTSNSTTVALATTPSAGEVSGVDAVQLGWLSPGDVVSIGTIADPDADTATAETISAVVDSDSAPTITISSSITTDSSDFVVLGDGAVGTKESAGLVTIAGTTDNSLGGLDPDTAGEGFWKPAKVDSTSTLPDLDLLLRLNRAVTRRTGKSGAFLLTSLKQLDNIYSVLQSQVRFAGDKSIGAGGSETVTWRGMEIHAFPQVPENLLFFLTLEDLEIVTGKYSKPTWMSDIEGGGRLHWTQGATKFTDTVMFALGLAARRRNSHAAATKLTA